ncbi:MAG TPA: glycosyltransferase [Candidatus Magasanikbacteria bacterium]|nr:glycosyltransferase [Candidatus Magasanikbacteria bacterium]
MNSKKLALFFTEGVSLKTWEKIGNLEREIKPYIKLAENYSEVYFFTYGGSEDEKIIKKYSDKIKVCYKKNNLNNLIYSFLLPFFYKKELKKIAVYKTNQMSGAWTAVLAKKLFKKKLIVRCGYEWLDFLKRDNKNKFLLFIIKKIEKFVYKNADKIIITSKKDQEFIINNFKINPEKIAVINNYIDTNLFIKKENNKNKKNKLVFVGRFNQQKNLFNLLEAVNNLKVELNLIGSGGLEKELKEKAKNIKMAQINFLGNILNENLPEKLNENEIFVFPSLYEGNPKALLEAMSVGLAILTTKVKGIREIVKHKENGYLVETNSDSIKKGLEELLNNDELRNKISRNARKTIEENFSFEEIIRKELNLHKEIVCQK